jgi:tRNA (guanine37-N1)-methyltransferase
VRIDIVTIFPGIFESPLRESLLGRAIGAGLVDVRVHDLRDATTDKHRQVDDESYGGGPGMVMKPEPVFAAVESLGSGDRRTLLLSPAGRRLDQDLARELAAERLVPGVIGREESHEQDSFGDEGILDHPHYTRPADFRGMRVPETLLSGNHAEIERWRREAALEKTRRNRPDLLER